jgi:5-methyltetrahydrofolate--homocysteine methyltransferase
MSPELIEAIAGMKEREALDIAGKMLDGGADPLTVLDLCRQAVEIVGKRFEEGKYFLPELMMAGEMLKQISEMAKPLMEKELEVERSGKVLMGTVEGDIHDLGKDIVTFLLDVNGFYVHDLGVDVPPVKFVEAINEIQPRVVGMSGLLTLAYDSMKNTVNAIQEAGLRDKVKIMIGGGGMSDDVREYAGADAYGPDAMAAVNLVKDWMGEE